MTRRNLFPSDSGDAIIICKLPNGEPYLFGVSSKALQEKGSPLYTLIRQSKHAQQTPHSSEKPVVQLDVDADEMAVLLEAVLRCGPSTLVSSHHAIWRSLVLALLSPSYGTPSLTSEAAHHLHDVFCVDPDSVYQLPFARSDFTTAVAAVRTALASEELRPWLLPLALAYCAQFSPALMLHPTSFKGTNPPTRRLLSLPDGWRDVCISAHDNLRSACEYRIKHVFRFPSLECVTPSACRPVIESVREEAESDPTLIGATTKPSPKLAKRLAALCAKCLFVIDWHDDCSLFVIWSNMVFPAVGDSRSWEEVRECALQYLDTLPPVEPESRDDSSGSSSESESESRGRASGSRKKAKVLTSEDDRGFIEILSKALNWLE
ncbi:hypothetical protein K523DRAFT_414607 [Schizophyllum commune Tattone D]|nr:hypothetical protein K523DRAFT_414607 [Schizophyllum commune Tattone D]